MRVRGDIKTRADIRLNERLFSILVWFNFEAETGFALCQSVDITKTPNFVRLLFDPLDEIQAAKMFAFDLIRLEDDVRKIVFRVGYSRRRCTQASSAWALGHRLFVRFKYGCFIIDLVYDRVHVSHLDALFHNFIIK